jgi:hypothetical protein
MPLHEACIFEVQRLAEAERATLGRLVLAMRRRMRFLDPSCIHIWVPDAGPSEELLAEARAAKFRALEASGKKPESSFRRSRLAPQALEDWERYWWERFAPAYRRELHSRQSCRAVVYGASREDRVHPMSPADYLLSLDARGDGAVTLMCCEPNLPHPEECHRRLLLADLLALQAVRGAQGQPVRLKVRMRREIVREDQEQLRASGVELEPIPYQRLGPGCLLYAAVVREEPQLRALLLLPGLESLEPMPRLALAVVPS